MYSLVSKALQAAALRRTSGTLMGMATDRATSARVASLTAAPKLDSGGFVAGAEPVAPQKDIQLVSLSCSLIIPCTQAAGSIFSD